MRTKYLLKLKYCEYNLKYNILYKKIFYFWFFRFDHNLKNDNDVFLISEINWGPQVVYSWMKSLNDEEHVL